jgi:hypothetical protein
MALGGRLLDWLLQAHEARELVKVREGLAAQQLATMVGIVEAPGNVAPQRLALTSGNQH